MTDIAEAGTLAVGESASDRGAEHVERTAEGLRYRADIDGLRAIAIAAVVAFHAFPGRLPGGFVGVDIFFVISGFLISQIVISDLIEARFSFAGFYARRIRRLFPSLFTTLVAVLILGWLALPPELYEALGKQTVAGAAFSANVLDWQESGYFSAAAESKPLLHLWSLGIEEQFYVLWPLFLWLVWRWRSRHLILAMAGTLAVASFGVNVQLTHTDPGAAFYLPHARFWELLVGCLLAWASLSKSMDVSTLLRPAYLQSLRDTASVAGFLAIGVAVTMIDQSRLFPGWWALLPTLGTALIIVAGPAATLNKRLLSTRLFVWIGLISFQLYLWHWPLLVFLNAKSAGPPAVWQRAFVVAASVALAWFTFEFVDKPIRFGRRKGLTTAASCVALTLVAALGMSIVAANGVPSRYPQNAVVLTSFKYDYASNYRLGSCFLNPGQNASDFGTCTDAAIAPGARSILLWGDSHAAHLYPGLKAALAGSVKLTELTASMCPPFINFDYDIRPFCKGINSYVADRISRDPPDEVILSGFWEAYDFKLLGPTIDLLKHAGVKTIVVVGPVPNWIKPLPQTIENYLIQHPDTPYVPQWTKFGLSEGAETVDRNMAVYLTKLGVHYVSALKVFCNERGCMTRTKDSFDSLPQWDSVHLTTAGSSYFLARSNLLLIR